MRGLVELGKLQAAKARRMRPINRSTQPSRPTQVLESLSGNCPAGPGGEELEGTGRCDRARGELDPFDYPQEFFLNSVANYNLRNMDAAEKSALETERLDTEHHYPQASHLLASSWRKRQDYSGAAGEMRNY